VRGLVRCFFARKPTYGAIPTTCLFMLHPVDIGLLPRQNQPFPRPLMALFGLLLKAVKELLNGRRHLNPLTRGGQDGARLSLQPGQNYPFDQEKIERRCGRDRGDQTQGGEPFQEVSAGVLVLPRGEVKPCGLYTRSHIGDLLPEIKVIAQPGLDRLDGLNIALPSTFH
jgi:hypothetical protein